VGAKSSICQRQTTTLTGPISPACDQYIQYLLTRPTHRSLTDTSGGYRLEGIDFPHTTLRPSQPSVLPFPPKGPVRSPVYLKSTTGFKVQVKGPMAATWSSNHSAIYRNLRLCLAITNDLSLVIGSSRIDHKVTLMQLGHQFNSYNLMHIQES
jgi:hypothetical protein